MIKNPDILAREKRREFLVDNKPKGFRPNLDQRFMAKAFTTEERTIWDLIRGIKGPKFKTIFTQFTVDKKCTWAFPTFYSPLLRIAINVECDGFNYYLKLDEALREHNIDSFTFGFKDMPLIKLKLERKVFRLVESKLNLLPVKKPKSSQLQVNSAKIKTDGGVFLISPDCNLGTIDDQGLVVECKKVVEHQLYEKTKYSTGVGDIIKDFERYKRPLSERQRVYLQQHALKNENLIITSLLKSNDYVGKGNRL